MAKIRIVIAKGNVETDVSEITGTGCRDLTRPYLEAIGVDQSQVQEEIKPEMHQTTQVDQQL
jgi:hypothetical protein